MKTWFKKHLTKIYIGVLTSWSTGLCYTAIQTSMPMWAIAFIHIVVISWAALLSFDHFYCKVRNYQKQTLETFKQIQQIIDDYDEIANLHNAFAFGYNELDDAKGKYVQDNVYVKIHKPYNDYRFFQYMERNHKLINREIKIFHENLAKFPSSESQYWFIEILKDFWFRKSQNKYLFVKDFKNQLEIQLCDSFKTFISGDDGD